MQQHSGYVFEWTGFLRKRDGMFNPIESRNACPSAVIRRSLSSMGKLVICPVTQSIFNGGCGRSSDPEESNPACPVNVQEFTNCPARGWSRGDLHVRPNVQERAEVARLPAEDWVLQLQKLNKNRKTSSGKSIRGVNYSRRSPTR
jgi:hypothetical protein